MLAEMSKRVRQTRYAATIAFVAGAGLGCPGQAPTLPSATSNAATGTSTTGGGPTSGGSTGDDDGSTGPGGSESGTSAVDDTAGPTGAGSIIGTIEIVNANNTAGSTVALVPASAYVPNVYPSEVIATAPDTAGRFSFTDVPAGPVYVFGSLADDGLVVDPDPMPGQQPGPIFVDVVDGETHDVGPIKVVGAMTLLAPSGPGLTRVRPDQEDLALTWIDESWEDSYQIRVFDSLGLPNLNVVLPASTMPEVLQNLSVGDYPPGEYQVRVTALADTIAFTATDESVGRFAIP
jgi:hypothetical protein